MRRLNIVLVLLLTTIAASAQTQLSPELQANIDKVATDTLTRSGVPSASVAIVKDGRIVYVKAYGDARLDPRTPATPEMRYSIGSISKQFTAAGILLLRSNASFRSTTRWRSTSRISPAQTKSRSGNCCRTPPATRITGRRIM